MYSLIIDPMPDNIKINLFDHSSNRIISETFIKDINLYKNKLMFNTLLNRINKKANLDYKTNLESISYRFLFGNNHKENPMVLDNNIDNNIQSLISYAPFHIPTALNTVKIFKNFFKNIKHELFFETSFFTELPKEQMYYAIPYNLTDSNKIKRYGFHSIFHSYACSLMNRNEKIISICLDKKITICSIANQKPKSISFGFTPLEGIMGRTSCGDIDPGIIFHLIENEKFSISQIDNILKNESGFFGLTGKDIPIDELFKFYGNSKSVTLAFDILKYQIITYIGRYYALLNGIDSIIFGGEYADALSPMIYSLLKQLFFIGINLKPLNIKNDNDMNLISTRGSKVKAILINKSFSQIMGEKMI